MWRRNSKACAIINFDIRYDQTLKENLISNCTTGSSCFIKGISNQQSGAARSVWTIQRLSCSRRELVRTLTSFHLSKKRVFSVELQNATKATDIACSLGRSVIVDMTMVM